MLANDQLNMERSAGRVFVGFVEENIEFPPTYKYDPDTDRYDTSRKARIPSWTDRILYKPCAAEIVCDLYTSVQVRGVASRHGGVIGCGAHCLVMKRIRYSKTKITNQFFIGIQPCLFCFVLVCSEHSNVRSQARACVFPRRFPSQECGNRQRRGAG